MTKRLDEDALELVCLNFRDSFIDFLKHFLGRRNVPDESAGDGVLFIAQRSEEKFLILAGTSDNALRAAGTSGISSMDSR